jgi:Zn-dependent metalloprotease
MLELFSGRFFGVRRHRCHNPVHCILPPYVLDHMAQSDDPDIRRIAIDTIAASAAMRAMRTTLSMMPLMAAMPSPQANKYRLVYDMDGKPQPFLPGELVRSEGDPAVADSAVNEAYDFSGATYDFYMEQFSRNSLDGNGMQLVSSVHLGRVYNNAFWDGQQMAYGDGDGRCFLRFTKALDVVAHELTHGVVTHTCNLTYSYEPGALNEHFADVFGELVEQWKKNENVDQADWFMGSEIMGPGTGAGGLRTFAEGKAFEDDPCFGTDPQPKHIRDKYVGSRDYGGVHVNSGIPNHAFYRVAKALGGNAWEKAGLIWYKTMLALTTDSQFEDAAQMAYLMAGRIFGTASLEQKAVKDGWEAVGISV